MWTHRGETGVRRQRQRLGRPRRPRAQGQPGCWKAPGAGRGGRGLPQSLRRASPPLRHLRIDRRGRSSHGPKPAPSASSLPASAAARRPRSQRPWALSRSRPHQNTPWGRLQGAPVTSPWPLARPSARVVPEAVGHGGAASRRPALALVSANPAGRSLSPHSEEKPESVGDPRPCTAPQPRPRHGSPPRLSTSAPMSP